MTGILATRDHCVQTQRLGAILREGTQVWNSAQACRSSSLDFGQTECFHVPRDMGLPGLNLHELGGDRRGIWSVKVSGNWRVTFRFEGEDASDVDYEDYH